MKSLTQNKSNKKALQLEGSFKVSIDLLSHYHSQALLAITIGQMNHIEARR